MKIVATIEARMTSSRLPGKVLLPAMGKPMLYHLVNRLKAVPSINEIVLATTINATDDVLIDFSKQESILSYRGSEEDVMSRVIGAAETADADVIVEITGDCPIIDPDLVEQTIQMYLHHEAAYASNTHISSYPDGMDTQVFSLESLKRSSAMTDAPLDHEHVSLYMRNHPEIFPHVHLIAPPSLHWPSLGLTLDEQADYLLLKKIIETLSPENPLFSCLDTIELLKQNPDWLEINRHVVRKGNT
ncbi:Spore coat polysaccharide biosynthesis protein SpsF [Planktothrix agardhii]|jgi:spore coat polysaccharide biosynthesis protein SpsF|uniref:cytidylyltransferase domain-containing protein n=1 Tax=Planktothrix agardhii TaxID=1160 RepID=UPI0003F5BA4C|nr:glycosyltransferase family protein [Planktothrix agardhii]CAD5926462.1 Spore coat polysaccharide biosynthesis protein SpsF [Planktothrix agardhii]